MSQNRAKPFYPVLSGIGAGILYGLVSRFLFNSNWDRGTNQTIFAVMTLGFIFLVPFALGFLTVYISEFEKKRSWWFRIFMPWVPGMALMVFAALVGWEGSICLLMALPIFLIMSSLGGITAPAVLKSSKSRRETYSIVVFILVLPYVSAPIESGYGSEQSLREVKTGIVIRADRETVWRNIERVPRIKDDEHRFSFFILLDFRVRSKPPSRTKGRGPSGTPRLKAASCS
jgi:hypothetical protein